MRHRIFIAINLPEDIKKTLADFQKKWQDLPARWVNPENIHITLVFVGYVEDKGLEEIKRAVGEVVKKHPPFSITLNEICYSPYSLRDAERRARLGIAEHRAPRMIWVVGESSDDFISLKNELEKELTKIPKIFFKPEKRDVVPHITLARIKEWEWRRIEPDERPEVKEEIDLTFPVNSIEIMESNLKRGGAEYTILESFNL